MDNEAIIEYTKRLKAGVNKAIKKEIKKKKKKNHSDDPKENNK